jgi:hypothetical protein
VSTIVAELERRLLPQLAEVGRQIERDFPATRAHTFSCSCGSSTPLQGHVIGLSCSFPVVGDVPDGMGLVISVRHLSSSPELDGASVDWNHPSGASEIDLIASPVPCSQDVLADIEHRLGALVEALRRGVARGKPPE